MIKSQSKILTHAYLSFFNLFFPAFPRLYACGVQSLGPERHGKAPKPQTTYGCAQNIRLRRFCRRGGRADVQMCLGSFPRGGDTFLARLDFLEALFPTTKMFPPPYFLGYSVQKRHPTPFKINPSKSDGGGWRFSTACGKIAKFHLPGHSGSFRVVMRWY